MGEKPPGNTGAEESEKEPTENFRERQASASYVTSTFCTP